MSVDLRYPNITGKTEAEQLSQVKSYLHQLVDQLTWALSNVDSTIPATTAKAAATAKATATASTTSQDDPISNFNSIKGLIITSADIVNAYYDKIDELLKLSGDYTASSDFGTFKEETLNLLSATNTQIQQNVSSLQQIFDKNGNIRAELLVNGHIYSGIIEYAKDGEAIVGIEIGQTTQRDGTDVFTKFARFTADRLSFYDINNEEVAYISDYKLYITHVEIKGSLKMGGYEDTITADGGTVTKWVGGG